MIIFASLNLFKLAISAGPFDRTEKSNFPELFILVLHKEELKYNYCNLNLFLDRETAKKTKMIRKTINC